MCAFCLPALYPEDLRVRHFTFDRAISKRANLFRRQSPVIYLYTRDLSFEMSFIAAIRAKSDRKLGAKLYLTNISTLDHSSIVPQLCYAGQIVIGCANLVPFVRLE